MEKDRTLLWPIERLTQSISLEVVDHVVVDSIKVFLGGTCENSTWREELIPMLEIGYFDPVAEKWTPRLQKEERDQRDECEFLLYVITPKMSGVYSIAEVVDDSHRRQKKTILCILDEDGKDTWDDGQKMSMAAVEKMVKENGCKTFKSLKAVAKYLNSKD